MSCEEPHLKERHAHIDFLRNNLAIAVPLLLLLLGLLVLYYVLLVRAIIHMLRLDVHSVLITFAFLSLLPFPLVLIAGVMVLIIWRYHRRDLEARTA
jgi:hypothetical protein